MAKQIEMNYKLDSGYEVLYPSTLLANVTDWSAQIYSKSEIDSKISTINDDINNIQMNPGGWENLGTFSGKTGVSASGSSELKFSTTVALSKIYCYWVVINIKAVFNGRFPELKLYFDGGNGNEQIWAEINGTYEGNNYNLSNYFILLFPSNIIVRSNNQENSINCDVFMSIYASPEESAVGKNYFQYDEGTNLSIRHVFSNQEGSVNVSQNDYTIYRQKIDNLP